MHLNQWVICTKTQAHSNHPTSATSIIDGTSCTIALALALALRQSDAPAPWRTKWVEIKAYAHSNFIITPSINTGPAPAVSSLLWMHSEQQENSHLVQRVHFVRPAESTQFVVGTFSTWALRPTLFPQHECSG